MGCITSGSRGQRSWVFGTGSGEMASNCVTSEDSPSLRDPHLEPETEKYVSTEI